MTPSRRFLKTQLPLPLLDPSKEHYQKLDMVYGKPPSEKDRPSYVATPSQEAKDNDKKSASVLVSGKVRACIQCGECHKARCVYSQCRLNLQELNEITRIKESDIYTCGSILFPPGSKHEKSIVREALTCNSTIETQYYSAKLVSFPPICYHCGIGEECIVNDEEIQELKKKYAVPFVLYVKVMGKKSVSSLQMLLIKHRKA